jgi:hypothetical protein
MGTARQHRVAVDVRPFSSLVWLVGPGSRISGIMLLVAGSVVVRMVAGDGGTRLMGSSYAMATIPERAFHFWVAANVRPAQARVLPGGAETRYSRITSRSLSFWPTVSPSVRHAAIARMCRALCSSAMARLR